MAVFLPIVPNWKNGVQDVYEFRTEIFTSRDGSEQRRAQRIQPRRSMTAAVMFDGDRLRSFADAVNKAKDGKVEVSDFSGEACFLTATAMAGDILLNVDALPSWLKAGESIALVTGRRSIKVRVDFIDGLIVGLTAPLSQAVGFNAKLLPIIPASLETSNTLSVHTTQVSTGSIKLNVEPGTVLRAPDQLPSENIDTQTKEAFGPAALFYGRYVLLRKPNYLNRPQTEFNLATQTVDYGRGVIKTFAPVPMISRTLTATYVGQTRENVLSILDIFLRAKGRAGEIYVPTWGHDFPEVLAVSIDSIKVKGTDFFDTYYDDPAHAAVLIRTHDDKLRPREIKHMYESDGDTWVVFTTEIGAGAEEISHISWMFVARFAQDALTVDWKTDGKATVLLSFVTLRNLAVEDGFGENWILSTGFWRDRGVWEDTNVWRD